jgi:hypothetical protein
MMTYLVQSLNIIIFLICTGIDDDLLRTGIMLYHLKEGTTTVGSGRGSRQPDITLAGIHMYMKNL